MDFKETLVYVLIAAIIVVIVLFALGGSILGSNYNVNVSLSPVGQRAVYPYQTSQFAINVTNNGSKVNNLLLGFYINGISISTNTLSIPAHQSVTLYRNYTYTASGNYSFQAVADPGHVLNIKNRQSTVSSFTSRIMQPQTADVYSSIPNSNITSTQEFTLSGLGTYGGVALVGRYNITLFNQLFGPSQGVTTKIFQNLASRIVYAKGAYIQYANNSVAYAVWLQGTVNTQLVNNLLSSFVGSSMAQYNNITYTRISNTLSVCDWYNGGWTKLISYYNNSRQGTCMNLAQASFNSSESAFLANSLLSNANLVNYQTNFYYTNSTQLGSILSYSGNSMTATRLFNNTVGLFASSISALPPGINTSVSGNLCYGLIYNNGTTHVCSVVLPTRNGSITLPFELVKTTAILPKYLVNVYSLVNSTLATIAHINAANLIDVLTKNSTSVVWTTGFQSSCYIENPLVGCKFSKFNYTNSTASLNITNTYKSSLKIKSISCELVPGFPTDTINQTIAANKTATLKFKCYNPQVPSAAPINQYTLNMTYVVNNATSSIPGLLNVTNQALSSYT
ncbi:MAG: CARDB domain-containing protein [Candidatus Micrarchaeaceae archaeon]|jgi:hypothetical protein|nr:hypothetical protein [Candidatus Micrarchaeota archaeon]